MKPAQVMATFATHNPIRDEQRQVTACRCDPDRALTSAEHTWHLAEEVARSAATIATVGAAACPSRYLPAAELSNDHLNLVVCFPHAGAGVGPGPGASVTGVLLAVGCVDTPAGWRVALAVFQPDLRRERAYLVKPASWVELASPAH